MKKGHVLDQIFCGGENRISSLMTLIFSARWKIGPSVRKKGLKTKNKKRVKFRIGTVRVVLG